MKIINPYNKEIRNISVEELTQLYYTIKDNGVQSDCEVMAKIYNSNLFLLLIIKCQRILQSLLSFIAHELLAKNNYFQK